MIMCNYGAQVCYTDLRINSGAKVFANIKDTYEDVMIPSEDMITKRESMQKLKECSTAVLEKSKQMNQTILVCFHKA